MCEKILPLQYIARNYFPMITASAELIVSMGYSAKLEFLYVLLVEQTKI